ncbi:MAG: ABC transporter substrate-binding protein [Acidobacteria bacterium]|nr:ABC transporter substrate-binding protein [Acidobacteriota bacterium]
MKRTGCLVLLVIATSATSLASRTLIDEVGRTVSLPDHPHRLVSLVPSVTADLYALGAGSDVIAVSDYTKYPSPAAQKPSIGAPLTPSIETILSLHPDLVIGSADTNREETVHQLEHLGLAVFVVNPHGIEGVLSSISSLGEALGRRDSARALVSQLRARLRALRARVQTKPAIRVFMPIWYDPVVTIGKHAFITELIQAAGGKSVTDDINREWPEISLETVIERKPEALVLMTGSKMTLNEIEGRPGWKTLDAVRHRKVYLVDERIELPCAAAFDAMEDLAEQLHPRDERSSR